MRVFCIPTSKLIFKVSILSGCVLASGCGKLDFTLTSLLQAPSPLDFAKSEIISNGPAVADGTSQLLVAIQLTNSDGSSVAGFRPVYQVVSGGGVTASPCTTSNGNGISTCILRSVQPGTKRIAVTNISITLGADLVFTQPQAGQSLFGLASAGGVKTQGSATLKGTIGHLEASSTKTSGTSTLDGGFQGETYTR